MTAPGRPVARYSHLRRKYPQPVQTSVRGVVDRRVVRMGRWDRCGGAGMGGRCGGARDLVRPVFEGRERGLAEAGAPEPARGQGRERGRTAERGRRPQAGTSADPARQAWTGQVGAEGQGAWTGEACAEGPGVRGPATGAGPAGRAWTRRGVRGGARRSRAGQICAGWPGGRRSGRVCGPGPGRGLRPGVCGWARGCVDWPGVRGSAG